jgi:hypothetical protein|tara:strand:+ start:276 stop:404 length:129 start_codon:yes stop_codon:yes gene_type:complete
MPFVLTHDHIDVGISSHASDGICAVKKATRTAGDSHGTFTIS